MDKEILNMEEASELFGVSVKTFIKLLKEEKVPGRKIGREWRFSKSALIGWLSMGSSKEYSESERSTKEFYDSVAKDWEKIREGFYDESIVETMLQKCSINKEFKILDLGCGDGYLARAVAHMADTVIGIDISDAMLKEMKVQSEKANIKNIIGIKSDGRNLPLDDNEVDFICSNMYLHNIKEPKDAVIEIKRVLKTGGKIFLSDLVRYSNEEAKQKLNDVWSGFIPEEVEAIFLKKGFKKIESGIVKEQTGKRGRKRKIGVFYIIFEK